MCGFSKVTQGNSLGQSWAWNKSPIMSVVLLPIGKNANDYIENFLKIEAYGHDRMILLP